MRASGDQLRQITALVDQGALRPVVGKVFGFDQTPQALQSLAKGGIRGKAVITIPADPPQTARHTTRTTQENHHEQHAPRTNPSSPPTRQAPARTITAGGVTYAYRELGPEGRHPGRLLRPPRRDPGQLGPAHHRPDREGPPRHHLRQPRRRRLHRQVPDSVEAMADDAYTFIKALGFDTVDIFSFSLGGMVAQALVVKHPDLVRKLVLTGTGPRRRQGHGQGRPHHLLRHPARRP